MKSKKIQDKKPISEKNINKSVLDKDILDRKIKKISIVVPDTVDDLVQDFNQKVSNLFSVYNLEYVFVTSQSSKLKNSINTQIVKVDDILSYNERVVEGFKNITGDCVIICDMQIEGYEGYLQSMISAWQKGSKIVRLQYRPSNLNFWQKIGRFFQKLHQKIFNFVISFGGLNKQLDCCNSFQLYDKTVYKLMVAIPEKNTYLRNFDELKYFNESKIATAEKITIKNDKIKWSKKLITSTILLSVFIVSILLTITLSPVANQNNLKFSFTAIMIFVLFGSLSLGLVFLYSAILDFKLGKKTK